MSDKKQGFRLNGKGYYIALILCAAAIGISGYLYYANNETENEPTDPQLGGQEVAIDATEQPQQKEDLPVIGTQPQEVTATPTEPSVQTQNKVLQTVSPVEGQIVAVYAMDELSYNATTRDWRVHNGVDIAAEDGSAVLAAAEGTVYTVYEDETMGMTVVIRHADGYVTRYASLAQDVMVKSGDEVKAGQQIGTVGTTALLESAIGCHVHFSVSHNDQPVDPAQFLAQE